MGAPPPAVTDSVASGMAGGNPSRADALTGAGDTVEAVQVHASPVAPTVAPPTVVEVAASNGHSIPAPEATVWVSGATKRFDDLVAVDDVSIVVPRGTILGLIGPSGSGKTTTMRLLTGALAPDKGEVRVLGEDPRYFHRSTRERIGYSPQLFVLYPDLTAGENLDFVAALFGMLFRRRRRRVREVLELLGLWDARGRRASELSGGMQRRLELACALVHEPELLFLDEPTAGIDPLLRQSIWTELRRLRNSGRTLLVTTQYVGEAEYCDAVALIADGHLIALAPPEELRRQALGGDVIEVETERAFDVRALSAIEGVREVRQRGPRQFLVIAEDAGAATPRVSDALDALGADVTSSREYRPTFDEVFATLVEGDRAARGVVGHHEAIDS
jgi:ABC-2 type transport system ATP-binding protein